MTRHSSVEVSPTQPTKVDVPLSERPLVAVNQNTVISPELDAIPVVMPETPLTETAQEIRDSLFALSDDASSNEQTVRMGTMDVSSKIGSGGMGAVFKAVDLELSRTIALKILHPTIAADPSLVARFRNEARACAQLGHDNIARVFSAGEHDGVYYIAYEYAEGQTLKQLVEERGVLTPENTVNYAIQATLALNHLNSAGIVHRDIKPSNIILTDAGRIKVVDLGLARRETTDSIGDLTVAGTTLGTFDYIAPEQARDPRVADIRSDIYSLGCTLYHMLTGQPPYPEGTALQKLLDHQGKSPPDPRLISKDVPVEVTAIVQKMMNTDPENRYQDPGQLLADLMDVASSLGLRSVPAEGIVWRRVPVTRVRQLSGALFITGATIAICLTALAMQFLPDGNSVGPSGVDELRAYLQLTPDTGSAVVAEAPTRSDGVVENQTDAETPTSQAEAGSDKTSLETMNAATSEAEAANTESPFIVYHLDGEQYAADTLPLAWEAARNGDVIELNFDGPLETPTYRLGALGSVEQQQITIRAGAGHSPVLTFEGDMRTHRPSLPGQLFYLTSDLHLAISGIDFHVNVKEDVQDDKWVLFECNGANRIDMQDCTITFNNRIQREACVFRFNDQAPSLTAGNRTEVSLKNVIVRGGCDLVILDDPLGGQVTAQNCGFALDGSLIHSRGSNAMVPQGNLALTLNHTTSILSESAILMRASEFSEVGEVDRTLPKLDVISEACVYAAALPETTLVDIRGQAYREELQDHLTWNGVNNLYNGYSTFWVIESEAPEGDVRTSDFTEWVDTWQRMSIASEVAAEVMADEVWSNRPLPAGRQSLQEVRSNAFTLQRRFFYDGKDTTARHSVDAQGRIIGVAPLRLPDFPQVQVQHATPTPEIEEVATPADTVEVSPTADDAG